jgi:hypothetical protein
VLKDLKLTCKNGYKDKEEAIEKCREIVKGIEGPEDVEINPTYSSPYSNCYGWRNLAERSFEGEGKESEVKIYHV